MPVINVPMAISDEALDGLLSGDLKRHGGVIYDKNGRIFEHLKDLPGHVSKKPKVAKILEFATANKGKTILIVGGLVVVVASIAYGINKLVQSRKSRPLVFDHYLNEAQKGTLTLDTIVSLRIELETIDDDKVIYFNGKQLKTLMNHVLRYTEDLAAANQYQIQDQLTSSENKLIDLRKHLAVQEEIFKQAI